MKPEYKEGWWFDGATSTDRYIVYEDFHQIIVATRIRPEQRTPELVKARPCLENEDLQIELTFFELRPDPRSGTGKWELASVGSHFVSPRLLEAFKLVNPWAKPESK